MWEGHLLKKQTQRALIIGIILAMVLSSLGIGLSFYFEGYWGWSWLIYGTPLFFVSALILMLLPLITWFRLRRKDRLAQEEIETAQFKDINRKMKLTVKGKRLVIMFFFLLLSIGLFISGITGKVSQIALNDALALVLIIVGVIFMFLSSIFFIAFRIHYRNSNELYLTEE